jgi:hypothetical protein
VQSNRNPSAGGLTMTPQAGDATLSVTDPSSTSTGRLVNGQSRCRNRCS